MPNREAEVETIDLTPTKEGYTNIAIGAVDSLLAIASTDPKKAQAATSLLRGIVEIAFYLGALGPDAKRERERIDAEIVQRGGWYTS